MKELVRNNFLGSLFLALNSVDLSDFKRFFHDLKIAHFQTAIFFLSNYGVSFGILDGFPAHIKFKISLFIS